MRARCPGASALGTATLAGWRFVINPDGYGSIAPQPGGIVHGVLWRLTARDLAAINAYENVAGGLYVRRMLPVLHDGSAHTALIYIATRQGEGTPRPGYIAIVVDCGTRLGPAGAVYSLADALVAVGARRRAREGRRRARMSGLTIRRVVVRGRVQGVGYRAWTEDTAILNGLDGWVRNRRDGAVEAVFAGPPEAVDGMIEACRRGPDSARVDAVDVFDAGPSELAHAARRGRLLGAADGVMLRAADGPPKQPLEFPPQHRVHLRHGRAHAEIGEAGDAVARVGDAARHDAGEMRKLGRDIDGDAVQRHPALHADADGRDLVFVADALLGPAHPDADALLAPLALDAERRQRADDPFLERDHEAAHVGRRAA